MTPGARMAVLMLVAVGLWAVFVNRPMRPTAVEPTDPATVAPWWPSDFSPYAEDPSIAWRWMTDGEYDCTADTCWGMFVIPRDGCRSSLYVELAIEDRSGAAVGYTNDTAGAVSPGQRAKMTFGSYELGAHKARLAEVACY